MSPDNNKHGDNQASKLITATYEGCPDLLTLHVNNKERYPFLLQSTSPDNKNSRFDILFAFPQQQLVLNNNFELYLDEHLCDSNDFLSTLDELWSKDKVTHIKDVDIPFTSGWFLYFAYEFLGQIEKNVKIHRPNNDLAVAVRIPAAIICDTDKNISYLLSDEKHKNYFLELVSDFKSLDIQNMLITKPDLISDVKEEESNSFIEKILKAKKYIYDGDIFQSNLSREWIIQNPSNMKSTDLYNKLRQNNPAAFSGLAQFKQLSIISSSPERLIRVKNGNVETRPIAGTTQRDDNKKEDLKRSINLFNNPKERAEHVMLIDMERNDLGRVCEPGSIDVNEMMVIESIEHVHHIISNIKGKLKSNITPGEVIKAVFPGGSITGCPKVRCMQIIYELEGSARNSYTGSMGYLNNDGDMDLNILIRTIEKTSEKITFRTGAGIVNDSDVESELQETRIKAKGLISVIS